jgi:hypothetical protein
MFAGLQPVRPRNVSTDPALCEVVVDEMVPTSSHGGKKVSIATAGHCARLSI